MSLMDYKLEASREKVKGVARLFGIDIEDNESLRKMWIKLQNLINNNKIDGKVLKMAFAEMGVRPMAVAYRTRSVLGITEQTADKLLAPYAKALGLML